MTGADQLTQNELMRNAALTFLRGSVPVQWTIFFLAQAKS